jgi:hypothetical protein
LCNSIGGDSPFKGGGGGEEGDPIGGDCTPDPSMPTHQSVQGAVWFSPDFYRLSKSEGRHGGMPSPVGPAVPAPVPASGAAAEATSGLLPAPSQDVYPANGGGQGPGAGPRCPPPVSLTDWLTSAYPGGVVRPVPGSY